MTTIKRVGRAVLDDLEDRREIKWILCRIKDEDPKTYAEIIEAVGRAALEALRDPGVELDRLVHRIEIEQAMADIVRFHGRDIWRRMIEFMLSEGPAP